jgi:hypothetical protein
MVTWGLKEFIETNGLDGAQKVLHSTRSLSIRAHHLRQELLISQDVLQHFFLFLVVPILYLNNFVCSLV